MDLAHDARYQSFLSAVTETVKRSLGDCHPRFADALTRWLASWRNRTPIIEQDIKRFPNSQLTIGLRRKYMGRQGDPPLKHESITLRQTEKGRTRPRDFLHLVAVAVTDEILCELFPARVNPRNQKIENQRLRLACELVDLMEPEKRKEGSLYRLARIWILESDWQEVKTQLRPPSGLWSIPDRKVYYGMDTATLADRFFQPPPREE